MRSLLLTLVIAFALAAPAMAQGPSQDGYTPDGPQAIQQTRDGGDPAGGSDSGDPAGPSRLPFTGMDLMFLAGCGVGLVAVGAGMRRLTRPAV
jgi:hypothetical protein